MTDNFEDLEHHEVEHTDEPPQPAGIRSNLAEAWRTRPLFKLLVVMVIAGVAIAAMAAIFSGGQKEEKTAIVNPPDMHQAPGGKASPYFLEQTKEAEMNREKQALASGTSALPTPIGNPNDMNVNEKNDPLSELRAETARLQKQLNDVQRAQAQPGQQQNQQPEHFDEFLAQAMQQQMRQLMDSWTPHGIKQVVVAKEEAGASGSSASGQNAANPNTAANAASASQTPPPKVVVSAGTISYAQLLVEANSDVPGYILAQIVSGPLSGARAVGTFQIANGYNDYLVMHFMRANLKGKDYQIDAYALDPDTTLGGMATEVDERYFTRLILPAAASFLQGFGSAIGQSNQSTTVSNGLVITSQPSVGIDQGLAQGLGTAANTASQFFQNQANQTRPLVRVAAGTPMGLFFVNTVIDPTGQPDVNANANANPNGMYPMGYRPGMGYPGARYPGMGYPGSMGYPGMTSAGGLPGANSVGYSGYPSAASGVPYPNAGMSYNTGAYGANSMYNAYRPTGVYPGQGLVP